MLDSVDSEFASGFVDGVCASCWSWFDGALVVLSFGRSLLCAVGSDALSIAANAGEGIRPADSTSESAIERTQEAGLRITAPFL